MKIGIITLPFNNNYGGFLQAFALTTILKQLGHEVWFFDLQGKKNTSKIDILKKSIKKYILKKDDIIVRNREELDYLRIQKLLTSQYTRHFVDRYLSPMFSPIYSSNDISVITKNAPFDAFIAGSDQIWRPKYMNDFIKTLYFDFLQDSQTKRIAYAASFGTDQWEYSDTLTYECKKLVKLFHTVSVREDSGINLCQEHFNLKPTLVLDPTMLLNKADYIQLIQTASFNTVNYPDKGLFIYLLDENEETKSITNKICNQLELTPFSLSTPRLGKNNLRENVAPPVEDWINSLFKSNYVVTDSFHGTVFSIIFNKPFLAVGNFTRGLTRFTSLLKIFNLEDRLVHSLQEVTAAKINANINWTNVNKIWNDKKMDSINFIKESIL